MSFLNDLANSKKSLLDILIAAMVLTIFEIVFFRTSVVPTIRKSLIHNINKLSDKLAKISDSVFRLPGNVIQAITDEESILMKKYNRSVMYDGSWILGLLVIFILMVYNSTPLDTKNLDWFSCDFSVKLSEFAIFPALTTVFFILFQVYFFYQISKKYNYPSEDELQLIAMQSMVDKIKEEEVSRTK